MRCFLEILVQLSPSVQSRLLLSEPACCEDSTSVCLKQPAKLAKILTLHFNLHLSVDIVLYRQQFVFSGSGFEKMCGRI